VQLTNQNITHIILTEKKPKEKTCFSQIFLFGIQICTNIVFWGMLSAKRHISGI